MEGFAPRIEVRFVRCVFRSDANVEVLLVASGENARSSQVDMVSISAGV